MIDKTSVKKHFSVNAHNYDSYAVVQKRMAKRLLSEVIESGTALEQPEILEVGCGTGHLTGLLLNQLRDPDIYAYDIAPGMVLESKKKFRDTGVAFVCDDIESAQLKRKYDLVVSNATFQWFNDLESTCIKLLKSLKKGGMLAFSTFGEKTFCELYDSFESAKSELGIYDLSRLGQSFYGTEDLARTMESILKECGLQYHIRVVESLEYEYFDSVREFLHAVKKIGANNSNRESRIKNPKVIKRMMELYEKKYTEKDKIKVSYHCIYIVAEHKGER